MSDEFKFESTTTYFEPTKDQPASNVSMYVIVNDAGDNNDPENLPLKVLFTQDEFNEWLSEEAPYLDLDNIAVHIVHESTKHSLRNSVVLDVMETE